jgi:hypothetical protein
MIRSPRCSSARELRDRYLEQFNSAAADRVLDGRAGNYDVARTSVEPSLPAAKPAPAFGCNPSVMKQLAA